MKALLQSRHLITLLVCYCSFLCSYAEVAANDEYELKAAFVYNLARMVNWPPEHLDDTDNTLLLCVFGEDQFGAALDTIRHKKVRGHPLDIRYYPQLEDDTDISSCHLAFIHASETERLDELLLYLADYPILTVSDIEQFAERGGMVTLATGADQRIRLEINRHAAQQANLRISARLLALARLVETLE